MTSVTEAAKQLVQVVMARVVQTVKPMVVMMVLYIVSIVKKDITNVANVAAITNGVIVLIVLTLTYQVGQVAGTLAGAPHVPTGLFDTPPEALVQPSYGAPVLLASGSYDDSTQIGFINVVDNLKANVFTAVDGATAPAATVETGVTIIPEPATLALLAVGG